MNFPLTPLKEVRWCANFPLENVVRNVCPRELFPHFTCKILRLHLEKIEPHKLTQLWRLEECAGKRSFNSPTITSQKSQKLKFSETNTLCKEKTNELTWTKTDCISHFSADAILTRAIFLGTWNQLEKWARCKFDIPESIYIQKHPQSKWHSVF